ncbi:MAG: iron ABC transporter permease [Treponema sp.]|nr:iron ABC transporter permease [Treponema sp.]
MFKVLLYTLETALFSTITAAIVGIGAAFFVSKRNFPGRRILLSISAVPLCVPPLIVALGYVSFFGVNGTASSFIKLISGGNFSGFKFLYTSFGIILAQGFYNFPLVTGILYDYWSKLPKTEENAARLCGAGEGRVFFTVTLPKLSGALGAACIPVFLFCFFSFMIVMLFSPVGASTLEVELYHAVRTTLNIKSAAGYAIIETLFALGIVFVYTWIIRRTQKIDAGMDYDKLSDSILSFNKKTSRRNYSVMNSNPFIAKASFLTSRQRSFEWIFFIIIAILILLFFWGPAISIVISALHKKKAGLELWTFSQFTALFKNQNFWKAFANSLWVGIFTGFFSSLFGLIWALFVKLSGRQENPFFQTLPLLPMAISSVVISWLATLIFHRGNPVLLIFLQVFLYWPIAYRQIQNGINSIPKDTDRAARLFSKNYLDSVIRVYLPSCKKFILSAFAYSFAVSLGDASLPLVLSIPKFDTLALYVYKLASSYRFNQACACGIILTILCLLVFSFTKKK